MNKRDKFINIKSILSTVLNIIFYTILTILIIIIGLMITYCVTAKIYAKKGEEYQPPFALYMIISPSMVPNINVYDVIVNKRLDDINKLKVGDIITFKSNSIISNGLTVTHRIYKIDKKNNELIFTTKGDNNQNPDVGTIKKDDIYGKVILKLPQLGRITYFLGNKGVWLILILIPALGVIIYDILKILKLLNLQDKILDVKQQEKINLNNKNSNKKTDKKNNDIYLLNKEDEEDKKADKNDMFYVKQDKKKKSVNLPKLKSDSKKNKK